MNAEFFALAFLAALNPKLLALDLLLIENRRPRAMFSWLLVGGLTVGLTIGLLDVLVFHVDAINHQRSVGAGVDLPSACSCSPSARWSPPAACTAGARRQSRPGTERRRGRRRGGGRREEEGRAGRSGCWPSPGSGSPCSSAR